MSTTPANIVPPEKSVEEKLKEIIIEILGVTPEQITPEASFVQDLGADSLDCVEILMGAEEVCNVEIPDSDFEGAKDFTFAGFLKIVTDHLQK